MYNVFIKKCFVKKELYTIQYTTSHQIIAFNQNYCSFCLFDSKKIFASFFL